MWIEEKDHAETQPCRLLSRDRRPCRRHSSSSAVHWREGLFVAASEAIDTEEGISLTLPSGDSAAAEFVGTRPKYGDRRAEVGVAQNRKGSAICHYRYPPVIDIESSCMVNKW